MWANYIVGTKLGTREVEMRTNLAKEKLRDGKFVLGPIVNEYSPGTVEMFGAIGYDFVMIDCEHGAMTVDQVENMVRAAEVFNITPIARIPDHLDSTILRFLDRGVQGIIVPHVNTFEQASAIAAAARYFPEGHRGVGGGRPHDYGVGISRNESTKWVNSNTLVIPMVEEVEGVENAVSIASVEGVDILHVAPGDLGQSMGNATTREVRKVMNDVVPKIRHAGKWVGVGGNSPVESGRVADLIGMGANFITIGVHGMLRQAAEDFRGRVFDALR